MSFLDALRRKLHLRSLERGDYNAEGKRPESNVDAEAAAAAQNVGQAFDSAGLGYPPGYVNDYDDGRPRH